MALLITIGDTNKDYLRLKVPAKGEQNWSQDFKTEFALKISEHDHTGNGKGLQITTEALKDNAVTGAKLNANFNDLNDVAVSTASAGNILRYNGSMWVGEPQESTSNVLIIDETDDTVYSWQPEMLDNVYMYLSNGPDADLTNKTTSNVAGIIEIDSVIITAYSPDTPKKTIILPTMKNCIIKGRVNLNMQGNLENCIIDIDGDIFTNSLSGFDSCTIKANSIQNMAAISNSTNTVFNNCKIDVQTLTSDLTSGDSNKIKFVDSIINVSGSFSNSSVLDITDLNTAHLELDNSQVRVNGRLENLFGFLLDEESFLIAENYAQNNKEVVSLKMLRKDIGLLTTTFKDVNVNLNISLASNEYEIAQDPADGKFKAADPISHWTDGGDGQNDVGNYITAEGDSESGNWYRLYTHWFNQGVVFDNVNMTIDHSDYVWYANGASVGVDMVPSESARISSIVLPKIVRNSKIIVNHITSIPATKCIDIFQVSTNSTGVNYNPGDEQHLYNQTAPARFDVVHTGRPYFTNSSISQSFINSESTTEFNVYRDDWTAVEYRVINSTQSGTASVVAFNSKFDIWNVISGDSVIFENCKIYTNNEARFGDDIHLANCDIKCRRFVLKSQGDTTHSGIVVEDSNIRCWEFINSVNPSAAQSIKFHTCNINGTKAFITNSTDLGIYFHDCNLTFSSYFRGTSASGSIAFQWCTFNTSWLGKYQPTAVYFLNSNVDIGRCGGDGNTINVINYQSSIVLKWIDSSGETRLNATGGSTSSSSGSTKAIYANGLSGSGVFFDASHIVAGYGDQIINVEIKQPPTDAKFTNNANDSLITSFTGSSGGYGDPYVSGAGTKNKDVSAVQVIYDSNFSAVNSDKNNYGKLTPLDTINAAYDVRPGKTARARLTAVLQLYKMSASVDAVYNWKFNLTWTFRVKWVWEIYLDKDKTTPTLSYTYYDNEFSAYKNGVDYDNVAWNNQSIVDTDRTLSSVYRDRMEATLTYKRS